jgi:hypothetical protein
LVILSREAKDLLVRATVKASGGSDGTILVQASRRRTIITVLNPCCGRRSFACGLRMTTGGAQDDDEARV